MGFIIGETVIKSWQLFVAAGLIMGTLEVFIPGFIMLPIGIALLLTAPFTLVFDSVSGQLITFGLILGVVFYIFGKMIRPKFSQAKFASNVSSMIGKTVTVDVAISSADGTGSIKLYGDEWRAVSKDGSDFAVGEHVEIVEIEGNKVIVKSN